MTKHEKAMLAIAKDIKQYCIEQDLWYDCRIYFNGIAWDSDGEVIKDINPLNYFEYANPKTLSMSFEGPLYQAINYDGYAESDLQKILEQHGYYLELGHAWNFSIYKI